MDYTETQRLIEAVAPHEPEIALLIESMARQIRLLQTQVDALREREEQEPRRFWLDREGVTFGSAHLDGVL
ncbi:MAG TPA: hypothetical protein VFI96_04290 [Longimicrobiaceae bacterium]|nr:hypothetical protein [Longimicrobiaceae bacterium]